MVSLTCKSLLAIAVAADTVWWLNTHGHTVEEWRKICRKNERLYRQRHPDQERAKDRRKYLKRRPEILARVKKYRLQNAEKVRAAKSKWQKGPYRKQYVRRWYLKNSNRILTSRKEKYRANPLGFSENNKRYKRGLSLVQIERRKKTKYRWELANRERTRPFKVVAALKRRALKLSATVAGDKAEAWIIEVRRRAVVVCYYCDKKLPGKDCHIDHILALTKGGKHCIANLCTSCQRCNLSKGNRLIPQWEKAGQQIFSL